MSNVGFKTSATILSAAVALGWTGAVLAQIIIQARARHGYGSVNQYFPPDTNDDAVIDYKDFWCHGMFGAALHSGCAVEGGSAVIDFKEWYGAGPLALWGGMIAELLLVALPGVVLFIDYLVRRARARRADGRSLIDIIMVVATYIVTIGGSLAIFPFGLAHLIKVFVNVIGCAGDHYKNAWCIPNGPATGLNSADAEEVQAAWGMQFGIPLTTTLRLMTAGALVLATIFVSGQYVRSGSRARHQVNASASEEAPGFFESMVIGGKKTVAKRS